MVSSLAGIQCARIQCVSSVCQSIYLVTVCGWQARNSKNLALEAFFFDLFQNYFPLSLFTEDGYFCVQVLCFFIIVTFAACSTLSLPCAVSKIKKKKKIDPKLLMSCNKHLNHGSCGLDRFNQHVTHDYNIGIRNAVPWVSLFNLILLKPTACSG